MSNDLRSLTGVDRLLHEPSRMVIAALLYGVEQADFLYLLTQSGLTRGNLSSHLSKLEEAGYVEIEKTYRGKTPQTLLSLTGEGRTAFENYRKQLQSIVDQISQEK